MDYVSQDIGNYVYLIKSGDLVKRGAVAAQLAPLLEMDGKKLKTRTGGIVRNAGTINCAT